MKGFSVARNKDQICGALSADNPPGVVIEWLPVIFGIFKMLPCFKDKTPVQQRLWVQQKPKRAAREAAEVIISKTPGISHRDALSQGRKAVDHYLESSDEDVAVACAGGA